jgi:hypothetical protein
MTGAPNRCQGQDRLPLAPIRIAARRSKRLARHCCEFREQEPTVADRPLLGLSRRGTRIDELPGLCSER